MKKAILQFCTKHWKEILLIILALVVIGKMQSDMTQLEKAYKAARESYEQQIVGLQEIHDEELEAREQALEEYEAELARIEREYQEGLQEIERRVEAEERNFERRHTEAPTEVITEIENQFGFEYVE